MLALWASRPLPMREIKPETGSRHSQSVVLAIGYFIFSVVSNMADFSQLHWARIELVITSTL